MAQSPTPASAGDHPLTLRNVMTADPAFVSQDDTIQEAARLMDDLNVGSLPVCESGKLTGMITDRDITVRCTAVGKSPQEARVADAMSANVQLCRVTDTVELAREKMAEHQIRRLPVVDDDERLVGMVSMGDIATKSGDLAAAGDTLTEVSNPSEPDR